MNRRLLCTLLLGCALAGPNHAADKLRERLAGYEKLELARFKNKVGENLEPAVVSQLQNVVVEKINESRLLRASLADRLVFPKKNPDDDTKLLQDGTSAEQDGKTVLLFVELITFNKGSRAKRYLLGGGTGRAELRGNCFLIDKKSGTQLFYFQGFGETNWGLAGGGADKTLKGFAARVVDFLKGKY